MKRYRFSLFAVPIILAAAFFGFQTLESASSIHSETATCMYSGDLYCDGLCEFCHSSPTPDDEFFSKLHRAGDVEICKPCHDSETVLGNANLLSLRDGGNHPSQIIYDPTAKPDLKTPIGTVLFCGKEDSSSPWTCKLLCSTCHDVHSGNPELLQMSNQGSALCLDCHDK